MSGKPLHEAIREAYAGVGMTQAQVADRMGIDQTSVSRLSNGKWGEQGGPTPDLLARIENASGRPRGWILIQAGYVDPVLSVPDAIAVDPLLSDGARRSVLDFYRGAVEVGKHGLATGEQP